MRLAASRSFLPISRELLGPAQGERPSDLFLRLGTPKSPSYRVIAFYEAHNAIQNLPTGMAIDVRKVISLAGGLRADCAVPDRAFAKGPSIERTSEILSKLGVPFALGFQSAANVHAYFEPNSVLQLYIQPPRLKGGIQRLRELEGRPLSGHNHQIGDIVAALRDDADASRNFRYEIFTEDIVSLDVRMVNEKLPVTSPLQTILDLATHARMAAHLEFLIEYLRKQGGVRA